MNKKNLIFFLKKNNLVPSKKMGQNFLVCNNYKHSIVNLLDIKDDDNIIEIGPGFGALTSLIYEKNKNIKLIELDKRIFSFLKDFFIDIEIINDNFLSVDLKSLCNDKKYKVISNLPYSISSKAIIKLIKCSSINFSILMVQKEVAERIISKENSKNYNGFSVFTQMLASVNKKFDVPNTVFYPQPSVTSSIIKLENFNNIKFDIDLMEKFIKKCFGKKRKTIFNNLKYFFDIKLIEDSLETLKLSKSMRPENISVILYKDLFFLLEIEC